MLYNEHSFESLLCIVQFVFVAKASSLHEVVVDAAGLDGINQVQHRQTGADLFVLQSRTLHLLLMFNQHMQLHEYRAALVDKWRLVHLETGYFGWFSCLWQSLINPADDDVVVDLLAVAQAFQYIQSVSGETQHKDSSESVY